MSRNTFLSLMLTLFCALGVCNSATAAVTDTQSHEQEVQAKHRRVSAERMQAIKKNIPLTEEQEKNLTTALETYDKKRFSIWKQSAELRKSIDEQTNMSEADAAMHLKKLLGLELELEKANSALYKQLGDMGFSAQQQLKIYVSLKNFHRRVGRQLRN